MTPEEKQLLIKDLCARLPYGIMCRIDHDPEGEYDIEIYDERFIDDRIISVCPKPEQIFVYEDEDYPYSPEEIRPYLRSMSSMTREEEAYWNYHRHMVGDGIFALGYDNPTFCIFECFEWLNSHHFDYNGLIEKGLALEAPEGMYNI